MESVRRYLCHRVHRPIPLDGELDGPGWAALPWSEAFVDMSAVYDARSGKKLWTGYTIDQEPSKVGENAVGTARTPPRRLRRAR